MLNGFVASRSWQSRLRQADVLKRWPEVVGPAVADHSRPVKLLGDVLVISVDSSAWATQLTYMTTTLCAQVNEAFGGPVVSRIHLQVDTR